MRADRLSLLLTYLVAGLGAGATLLHASPFSALLLLAFIAVGALFDRRENHPLTPWALNTLTIVGLLIAVALPNDNGPIGRLMAASVVLIGGKLLAPKANRDQLQVMLLSLVLLVGAALLSVDLAFSVLFLAYLLLVTVNLVWLPFGAALRHKRVEKAFAVRVTVVGLGMVIGAVPLLFLFFVSLPRTAAPFWRGVAPAATAVSGFSDQVTLGDVGRIAKSSAVAFRAELLGRSGPLPSAPYWRGPVLEVTDGITWAPRPGEPLEVPTPLPAASPPADTVRQRIYLEPHGLTDLFALDRPLAVSLDAPLPARLQDGTAKTIRPVLQRVRYEALSDLRPVYPVELSPARRALDLQVPPDIPPVIAQRAREIVGNETDPRRKAERLLEHFHNGGYTYALTGLDAGPGHPLEVFLTRTKTGYCELFAASMALMLRTVGVPARMVAGYLGGDYNDNGNYYLVRQLSAHTWVEAYIDGVGWVRYDPTPPDQGPGSPAAAADRPSRFSLFVDALRLKWQTLVLGYNLDEQIGLFQRLARTLERGLRWRPGIPDLAVLALLLAAGAGAIMLWRRPAPENAVETLYATLLRRLRRRGLVRGPAEGPCDFAERAAAALPDEAQTIRTVTESYVLTRYGRRRLSPDAVRTLREAVRRI